MDPQLAYAYDEGSDDPDRLRDEMTRTLVEHARDVVLLVDLDGTIVFANHAAETAYGYPLTELRGMCVRDLRAPDTRSAVPGQMAEAAESGALFETSHMRRDGSVFPVEVSSKSVNVGGQPYLLSVIRDISVRLNRLAEMDQLIVDLELANKQLEALLYIVSSTVGRVDLDRLLAEVLDALTQVMEADGTLLFVVEDDELALRAYHGFDRRFEGFRMGIGDGFAGQVAAAGEPLWTADVTHSVAPVVMHGLFGIRAMYGIPLFLDGELYGVLECAWGNDRLVSEAERIMLQVAADRIVSAIAGAQRHGLTCRTQILDSALHEAADRLSASHELATTVPAAMAVARRVLDCDVAVYGHYQDGVWEAAYADGMDAGVCLRVPEHPERTQEAKDQLPVVRIRAQGPASEWLSKALGLAEAVIVPVALGGEWKGGILLGRKDVGGGFDDLTTAFARRLSSSVSLALANAREFDIEHRIAETLQEALLRLDGTVPGLAFGHLYRSATSAARVGGDFYDVFELPSGRVGVMLGDVSGKGLDAAVFTTLVKHTVRAFAHTEPGPGAAMRKANAVLSQAARLPDFASLVLLDVDPSTGTVNYCCAGHPPILVRRGLGCVDIHSCGSPVVGVSEDLDFEEASFVLNKGDAVVLYTDGVTEARDKDGAFFGETRLVDTIARCSCPLADIPMAIHTEISRFTDGALADDIGMVAFGLDT